MTELIAPPYPADTRAKGWRFEIDTEAIKASDTWLRAKHGAVKGALLLLWSEAWQQTPCGSLPDDDELLALLIDMPDETFVQHRAVLMRGWSKASDGRLYHDTITKRVLAMLAKRAKDAGRAAGRRGRIAESDANHAEVTRDKPVTPPQPTREFDTKHQAPSTKKVGQEKPPPAAPWLTRSDLVADGLSEEVATAFLAHRRGKKAKLTDLAWAGFKTEVEKAGWPIEAAVLKAIARNWTAFEAAWVAGESGPNRGAGLNAQESLEASNKAVGRRWLAEQGVEQ